MIEMVWSLQLKLKAMLKEIKWGLSLRKYSVKRLKELSTLLSRLVAIQSIIIVSDLVRIGQFLRETLSKKLIFIPFLLMLLLFTFYLSLINGEADKALFEEKIFPKFYFQTAIEIRDQQHRLVGTTHQPQSLVENPSLFVAETPKLFWSLLQEKYDPNLNFESNASSLYQSLFENPRYYNGIDIATPLIESQKLLMRIIREQDFSVTPKPTLTQQLMNDFFHHYPMKIGKNRMDRLRLAKTFFHQLKANNGANFKAWLLGQHSFFYIDGKGYGLGDCAEIFFGRKIADLSPEQEVILLAMYDHPYHLDRSLLAQQQAWSDIKKSAIELLNHSEVIEDHYKIVSKIKRLSLPKLPYFPDSLMDVVGQITPKNQENFSSLPTRSDALLDSSKKVIGQELDKLFQTYGISPQSRLVTKVGINFHISDNFYFSHYIKERLEGLKLAAFWVSVVNEEGEFIRLYQQNSTYQTPPQIGNLGKFFTALLFADRGDKYYTKYCNKIAREELPSEQGYERCGEGAWVDARRLFASSRMLPLYDGFIKYKERSNIGNNISYTPIHMKQIESLYQNLALVPLQNNEPRADLGAGKLQMTPLDIQVALHKVTQLLYNPNRIFYGAKLVNSLNYHEIEDSVIAPHDKEFSLDSPAQISPSFKNIFTREKRITLQTLFKAPIYQKYGSLQWLKNYINVKFVFAQESHKDGIHWLIGTFKKSGKYYSFTIHIQDKQRSKYEIKRAIQKILESTIESINRSKKMKFEYMKRVFKD